MRSVSNSNQPRILRLALAAIVAVMTLLSSVRPAAAQSAPNNRPAAAQSVPNNMHLLRHLQPRAQRALHKLGMAKTAAPEAVVLDQRWLYEWDGTDFWPNAQTVYVYDDVNRTEEWVFVWNGAAMLNQSRITYQGAGGTTVVEVHEEWDSDAVAFRATDRYTYSYYVDLFTGKRLHVASMTYETNVGDAWQPIERTRYEMPSATRMIGTVEEWSDGAWSPVHRITLTQDEFSVVQVEEALSGGIVTPETRTTFPGATIQSLQEWAEASLALFMDYAGLLYGAHVFPAYIAEEWNGADWIPMERQSHLFIEPDVGNGITFSGGLHEIYEDGVFVPAYRIVTSHRMSDNKPVQASMSVYDGSAFVETLRESYEQNNKGDMIRATQQVDSGEGLENSIQFLFFWDHIRVGVEDDVLPAGFALDAAYPNPFNPTTTIAYRLASPGRLAIRVYDTVGRQVATLFDGHQAAGAHEARFDAAGLSSGTYLVRLEAPGFSEVRAVTLLK